MKTKEWLNNMFETLDDEVYGQTERLYTSKAWVHSYMYLGEYINVLQSYATIVAVFIPSDGKVYVRDFYSNTTAQHCAKFTRWCRERYGKYLSGESLWKLGERIRVDKMK